jgi:hypothetical protein
MSSTQAALRRNASKSSAPSPAAAGRSNSGSIPSIRGANTFHQQVAVRPSNQNQMQQRSQQQQLSQQQQRQPIQNQRSQQQYPQQKTQMTIEQAITLITLRLGRLEVYMKEMEETKGEHGGDSEQGIGDDLAQNILTRLDALEENEGTMNNAIAAGTSSIPQIENNHYADKTELTMLKQQVDALKKMITSTTKTTNTANTASAALKNEMADLRKSLQSVEQITIENNTQLMLIQMNSEGEADAEAEAEAEEVSEDVENMGSGSAVYVEDEPDDEDIDE